MKLFSLIKDDSERRSEQRTVWFTAYPPKSKRLLMWNLLSCIFMNLLFWLFVLILSPLMTYSTQEIISATALMVSMISAPAWTTITEWRNGRNWKETK